MPTGIGVVSSTSGTRTATGQVGSAIDTTGADMIIVSVSGYNGTAVPSDSEGNTWTNLTASGIVRNQRLSYCLSPTTSSSHTFFCTNVSFPSMSVVAFSGVAAYEAENFSSDVSGTTVQAGSVTPSTNGSLVFMGAVNEAGVFTAVDSGFTLETAVAYASGSAMGNATAYLVQPSAASVNATLTCSLANNKSASVAVFTPAMTPDTNYSPFRNAKYINKTYQIPRFG